MQDELAYIPIHKKIANRSLLWYAGDSPENYKIQGPRGKNLYSPAPADISYKFNEWGFRSDSFTLDTDFGVVFVGCSQTVGVGLPLEHTWSFKLLERIREKTGKNIPYWNIAASGCGLDTNAFELYLLDERLKTKPVMVICLAPPAYRREVMFAKPERKMWVGPSGVWMKSIGMDTLFVDDWYARHQIARSCMTIDLLMSKWNSKFYIGMWDAMEKAPAMLDFIETNFPAFKKVDTSCCKAFNTDYARDGEHWGPSMNDQLVEDYWKVIEPDIESML
jgi:hypothetical protein